MAIKHGQLGATHQRRRHSGRFLGGLSVDEVDANNGGKNVHFGQSGCEWWPKWVRTTRDLDEVDATDVACGTNFFEVLRAASPQRTGARLRALNARYEGATGVQGCGPINHKASYPAPGDSH
jgi:hypothetical protein